MRADRRARVRRRVLGEAIAENIDTMRGVPPRPLRRRKRWLEAFLRRAPLLLVPLTLAASTYWVGQEVPSAQPIVRAKIELVARPVERPETEGPVQRVAVSAFPLSVRRVVLDPGHGGTDPGATALDVREKEVTLDIGRRLQRVLEQNGFEVVVTRPDDRTIALRERARLANDSRGDVFVSIHVNTIIKHTQSHGVETYYLGPTNDPKLTELAAAENSGSGYSLADLRKLLDGIYADARRDESRELADTVQKHLYTRLRASDPGLEDWGVKRAPFVVLVTTDMPAILAEVGCISNQREASMLGRAEYRQRIAEALFDGIHAYASAHEASQKKGI